jgi:hypothetical protein
VLASAACFVALKAGLEHAPPARLDRLMIGGASLLAVLAVTGGRLVPRRELWQWILGLGIAVTTFAYGAMAASLVFTGAGIASVLGNSQPLLAVALGVWLLGERIARAEFVALVLGLAGVVLVAFPATSGLAGAGQIGPLLALASSGGLVAASVIVKHVGPDSLSPHGLWCWAASLCPHLADPGAGSRDLMVAPLPRPAVVPCSSRYRPPHTWLVLAAPSRRPRLIVAFLLRGACRWPRPLLDRLCRADHASGDGRHRVDPAGDRPDRRQGVARRWHAVPFMMTTAR